jgi:superfamily II DNA or RNA helicase
MKKAVLSNRIWVNFNEELYFKAKEELTYKIPSKIPGDPPITICLLNVIGNKFMTFPIGRQDLIPDDYEVVDNRVLNPVEFPEFKFELRKSQQQIHDVIQDNCLINANVSWGKTFTAIAIAHKLKQKTLVITHTVNLRDQWIKEVKKTMGIKPGIIGGVIFGKTRKTVVDYKNHPIVIANVQTLRKHINILKKEFGTVILDEVHHCPAKIFSDCVDGMCARYKIGLSATLRRKDFMHVVTPCYFSNEIYIPPKENLMTPEVIMVQSDIPFSSNNMIPWANRVNELCDRLEYLDLITSISNRMADLGHIVLLVSDRTEFLDRCNNRLGDRSVMIIGPTDNRDELHKELEKKERDILCGAISIYKEGISLDFLSCLILGAPTNNDPLLEQLIGRIQREYPNKLTPIVVDVILKGATAKKQAKNRAGHYMRNGYKVTHLDLT